MNAAFPADVGMTSEVVSQPVLNRQDSKAGMVDSRFCCNICLEAVVEPVVTQCGHLYCWPCLYRWLEPGMQPDERVGLGLLTPSASMDSSRRVCPVCKAPCSVPTLVPIYVRSDELTPVRRETEDQASGQDHETDSRSDDLSSSLSGNHSTTMEHDEQNSDAQVEASYVPGSISGLRQRLRFRSQGNNDNNRTVEQNVPSRPAATSPARRSSHSSPSSTPRAPQYRNNSWMTPLTPNGHQHASLSHGILLSFQQATSSAIPPLHRREGGAANAQELDAHPDATEYLSRLLIMLASFVILCLLLL
jgi:E3 ubiquitin-protein ligase RNF5